MASASQETVQTPLTELFRIKYPIMLAGMNVAAGPKLAAAVTNAGGIGVIGGVGYTPKMLRMQIQEIKKYLINKNAPFGVDLLLPKVGAGARATNYDYTKGHLPELVDIIIEEKAALFVAAVGVPEPWVVEKMHKAGIPCMNMIGHPKHVDKALATGVDIICAQGGEGGGHTGDVPTSILIPKVVDLCRNRTSPLTGKKVIVVAAGGIYDGRGLAMALSLGADAAWVGTRFVAATEAGAPKRHKDAVVRCGPTDTIRTLIYTGRPLRVIKTPYITTWETEKKGLITELTKKGILPVEHDMQEAQQQGRDISFNERMEALPMLMGQVACNIDEVQPAAQIINEMMTTCIATLRRLHRAVTVAQSKL